MNPHTAPHDDRPISLCGRYELLRTLDVLESQARILGWDQQRERRCTVTILVSDDEAEIEQFLGTSSRTRTQISHHGIDRVLDAGQDGTVPFVVRDWFPGTVEQHLVNVGRVPATWAVPFVARCAEVVAWLHQHRGVHGGIRPDRVCFDVDGEPVLRDSDVPGRRTFDAADAAHLAPEVLVGAEPTQRSDVFSLGALLYTMVGGTPEPNLRFATHARLLGRVDQPLRDIIARTTAGLRDLSARQLHNELSEIARFLPEPSGGAPWLAWVRSVDAGRVPPATHDVVLQELARHLDRRPATPSAAPRVPVNLRSKTVILDDPAAPPTPGTARASRGARSGIARACRRGASASSRALSRSPLRPPTAKRIDEPIPPPATFRTATPVHAASPWHSRSSPNREVDPHAVGKPDAPGLFARLAPRTFAQAVAWVMVPALLCAMVWTLASIRTTNLAREELIDARAELYLAMAQLPDAFESVPAERVRELDALYEHYLHEQGEPERSRAAVRVLDAYQVNQRSPTSSRMMVVRDRVARASKRWETWSKPLTGGLWLSLGVVPPLPGEGTGRRVANLTKPR